MFMNFSKNKFTLLQQNSVTGFMEKRHFTVAYSYPIQTPGNS